MVGFPNPRGKLKGDVFVGEGAAAVFAGFVFKGVEFDPFNFDFLILHMVVEKL